MLRNIKQWREIRSNNKQTEVSVKNKSRKRFNKVDNVINCCGLKGTLWKSESVQCLGGKKEDAFISSDKSLSVSRDVGLMK